MKRKSAQLNFDPEGVVNNQYNDHAGSTKISNVGHRLLPIYTGTAYTTNATTRQYVGRGTTLAIYNNSGTVSAVTTGDVTVTSQAAGAVQAGTPANLAPFVGIPCKANDWTYINTYDHDFIIASAATNLVYIVQDHTVVS